MSEAIRLAAMLAVHARDDCGRRPEPGERFLAWHEPKRRWIEGYRRSETEVGSAIQPPWTPQFFALMPRPPTVAVPSNLLPVTYRDWSNKP